MKFGQNLKKAFSAPYLKQYLLAGVGATVYTVLPTMLKMQGWGAFALGFGSVFLLGVALDSPGLIYGVIGVALCHLIYSLGSGTIQDVTGSPVWRLGGPAPNPLDKNIGDVGAWSARPMIGDYVSGAPDYPSNIWSAPPTVYGQTMSDYQGARGVISDDAGYVTAAGRLLSDSSASASDLDIYGTFRQGIDDNGGYSGDSFFGPDL